MGKFDREYVSEFTHFINHYLEEHPEVVADQQRGRSIYWDKHVDLEEQHRAETDAVPVDSYYYFGNPWDPAAKTGAAK